jgi:hypothetical protein
MSDEQIVEVSGSTNFDGKYVRKDGKYALIGASVPSAVAALLAMGAALPDASPASWTPPELVSDLVYDAARMAVISERVKQKAADRKQRRVLARLRAVVSHGFDLFGPSHRMVTPAPEPTGLTRAERRRAKLGRS